MSELKINPSFEHYYVDLQADGQPIRNRITGQTFDINESAKALTNYCREVLDSHERIEELEICIEAQEQTLEKVHEQNESLRAENERLKKALKETLEPIITVIDRLNDPLEDYNYLLSLIEETAKKLDPVVQAHWDKLQLSGEGE